MDILVPAPQLPFTADALRRWLRQELATGPRHLDELAERLSVRLGRSVNEAAALIDVGVDEYGIAVVGPSADSIMLEAKLFEGVTFTHRITAAESETGVVDAFPDFAAPIIVGPGDDAFDDHPSGPGELVGIEGVRWANGDFAEGFAGGLDSVGIPSRAIVGPVNWLRDATDALLALTATPDGWAVSLIETSAAITFDPTIHAALQSALERIDGTETARVSELLLDAVAESVGAGTDRTGWIRPLSEVVAQSGRSVHQGLVGRSDFDWETHNLKRAYEVMANVWAVTPGAAGAMVRCLGAVKSVRGGAPISDAHRKALLADLTISGTVEGLAANVIQGFRRHDAANTERDKAESNEAIASLLTDLAEHAKGTLRARIDWLSSRLTVDAGDAQTLLRRAITHDPRFLPAHDDLVWFAAVNAFDGPGRARLDLALQGWVAANGVSPAVVEGRAEASARQILRFACSVVGHGTVRNTGPSVGRNDPCPCGSGRKYKQCHNGKVIDSGDRPAASNRAVRSMVPWVQALQLLWFERTNQRYFGELVEELGAVVEGDQKNLLATFVVDADVSEGTRTEEFLATALGDGATWPAGVAEIVRSWADRPFGLYEVEDRVAGQQLWVREMRSGERSVVDAPETSRHHGPGSMFLSRLVDNGEALQMSFGSIQVSLRDRQRALDMLDASGGRPDAMALARFVSGGDQLSSGQGQPMLRNTDGDEIVIHRSLVRPTNPTTLDAVSAAFAELNVLQRQEEESEGERLTETWHVIGDGKLDQTIRGAIQGGVSSGGVWLVVETNSARRQGEALALVRGAIGDFEQIEATVDGFDDRELAEEYADLGMDVPSLTPMGIRGGPADEITPEVMTEIALQLEARWMSESIPALGGLTPRQAADDPTRRQDLVALLASFQPSMPGMITFDPQRLARALGVDVP